MNIINQNLSSHHCHWHASTANVSSE